MSALRSVRSWIRQTCLKCWTPPEAPGLLRPTLLRGWVNRGMFGELLHSLRLGRTVHQGGVHLANFGELRHGEVRRTSLLRASVNKAASVSAPARNMPKAVHLSNALVYTGRKEVRMWQSRSKMRLRMKSTQSPTDSSDSCAHRNRLVRTKGNVHETIAVPSGAYPRGHADLWLCCGGAETSNEDGSDPKLQLQAGPHHHQAGDEGQMDQQGQHHAHRDGEQRSVRLRTFEAGTELFAHLQDSGKDEQVPLRDTSRYEGKRRRQALAVDEGKRS